jgi:preprotein translocase subunit YajC
MADTILVTLIIFSCIFGVIFIFLTTRNKERLALIENGADAKLFNSGKKYGFGQFILNLALLAIGVGVGVLVGALFNNFGIEEGIGFTSCIFIFGGIGLMSSFFMNRKLDKEEK